MSRILFLLDSLTDPSACQILGQWILNLQQKGHLVQLCLHTDRDAQDAYLPFCPCKALLHEAILQNSSLDISWTVYYRLRNKVWQGASLLWPTLYWGRDTDVIIADQSLFAMHCLPLFPGTCRRIAWISGPIRHFTPRLLSLYQRCDQILCSSDSLQAEFQQYFFRSGRVQPLCLPAQPLPPRRIFLYSHLISESLLTLLAGLKDPRWELWIWGKYDLCWQDALTALRASALPALPGYAPSPPADLILAPDPIEESELPGRILQMLHHPLLPSTYIPNLAKEPLHAIYHLSP